MSPFSRPAVRGKQFLTLISVGALFLVTPALVRSATITEHDSTPPRGAPAGINDQHQQLDPTKERSERSVTEPIPGMAFVRIPKGCFEMGDISEQVCLGDFYLGKYVVTQKQWTAVMGDNPSGFPGCDDCPVENVSWHDVQTFISLLNHDTGKRFRLPTEAEWEYAARSGGQKETWAGTSETGALDEYAWHNANAGGRTHPVGQKKPNGLGLYDMSGNVWQWTVTLYSPYKPNYKPNDGGPRVYRGGSWATKPGMMHTTDRSGGIPDRRDVDLGFRLAWTPSLQPAEGEARANSPR